MQQELADLLTALAPLKHVIVVSHQKPDGDAIGSSLAFRRILEASGKRARMVGFSDLAPRYRFLAVPGEIEPAEGDWLQDAEAVVSVDVGDIPRLEPTVQSMAGVVPLLNIDHHGSNTYFGDYNWVEPSMSSSGEMVWRLAAAGGMTVPREALDPVWVAIVTDTGRFSYDNTTPEVLHIAANLVAQGVEPSILTRRVFQSVPLREYRLSERALSTLELYESGRVACASLSEDDFAACDCGVEHTEDIINVPRNLEGVRVAVLFYEVPGHGVTKVSVRTDPPFDASELCARFGGGGHPRAAGCKIPGTVEEAKARVLQVVHEEWFAEVAGG